MAGKRAVHVHVVLPAPSGPLPAAFRVVDVDDELDPARLAVGLRVAADALLAFFGREAAEWVADLTDASKRAVVHAEIRLATDLLQRMAALAVDHRLTAEDIRAVRRLCGFDQAMPR